MLRIALIGAGRIGKVHARSLARLEGVRVVAVADAVPAAAEALAASADAQARAAQDALTAADVDAVVIGSPTPAHFDQISLAAGAGKAIFCEKPVDLCADRVRDLIDVVGAAPFMVGFNRRFDPGFAALKARIAAGAVGALETLTITSRDPAPPPPRYVAGSGGLFRDMMIHDFDMARFLLGEEPVAVRAVGAALVDAEIGAAGDVDTAAALLTTASGRICQISCSRRSGYGYDQRVEAHGAAGMLRAENQHETNLELADAQGFRRDPARHFFLERYAAAYEAEMAAFVAAVSSGAAPEPGLQDGLRAQLLADAATQAWREDRVTAVETA